MFGDFLVCFCTAGTFINVGKFSRDFACFCELSEFWIHQFYSGETCLCHQTLASSGGTDETIIKDALLVDTRACPSPQPQRRLQTDVGKSAENREVCAQVWSDATSQKTKKRNLIKQFGAHACTPTRDKSVEVKKRLND